MTALLSHPIERVASDDEQISRAITIDRAKSYADAAHAANTRRCYASDLRGFAQWCELRGFSALPALPQTVVLYVTNLAERSKIATIRRHLAAITFAHRERGLESPVAHEVVRRVVRGIARTNGTAQTRKSAVTVDVLKSMLLAIRTEDLKAIRDRSILLLGFGAALRRSEIAELNFEDLSWNNRGLVVTIRRSKTDQAGAGHKIAIPFLPNRSLCAATAVRTWLTASGLTTGPLFRSFSLAHQMTDSRIDGRSVADLVKSLTARAHIAGDFSGHSLRAGFITSAARAKVSLDSIARTSRHKSLAVLMSYVRPAQVFDDVALTSIIA